MRAPPSLLQVLNDGSVVVEPIPVGGSLAASAPPPQPPAFRPRPSQSNPVLVYDGNSGSGVASIDTKLDEFGAAHRSVVAEHACCGLVGILDLGTAQHLLYIAAADLVATVADDRVYRVQRVAAIPISAAPYHSMAEEQWEATSLANLLRFFNSQHLYYSRERDLTLSAYRQQAHPAATAALLVGDGLASAADANFLLNRELLEAPRRDLAAAGYAHCLADFFVGVVAGFVGSTSISTGPRSPPLSVTLMSRMNTRRLGRRYYSRGMDPKPLAASVLGGGCSMAVETELLLETRVRPAARDTAGNENSSISKGELVVASHLQSRGSVPLVWSQTPADFEWKPAVCVSALGASGDTNPVERYLRTWAPIQPHMTFLDLLDRRQPHERTLSELFEQACSELRHGDSPYYRAAASTALSTPAPSASTSGTDEEDDCGSSPVCWPIEYHSQPVTGRTHAAYQRAVAGYQRHPGVTTSTVVRQRSPSQPQPPKVVQRGIFRTNCLDSIDRTNIIQAHLSELALPHLLVSLGAPTHLLLDIVDPLRILWVANGHALARHYIGTDAVHQDMILSGHRARCLDVMADGVDCALTRRPWFGVGIANEMILMRRYYTTYFLDPDLQDMLGELLVRPVGRDGNRRRKVLQLQRRRSVDECSAAPVPFTFVFLRKRLAPRSVCGLVGWAQCFLWLLLATAARWWEGTATGLFRRPRDLELASGVRA
ncbi:SacI homology domain-containing protein [Blastocladiella britannica]|nr:SacI homology domain-containing protein [Blastocladiella britannica]